MFMNLLNKKTQPNSWRKKKYRSKVASAGMKHGLGRNMEAFGGDVSVLMKTFWSHGWMHLPKLVEWCTSVWGVSL
jgi:hypothetical protein